MTALLYVVIAASAVVFVVATAVRAVGYARQPLHLRWELYPVPHEAPEHAAHGGSYFEDSEWWTHDLHFSLMGELKAMVPEMLFLKALREFNVRLWRRSFPFHFGLYLLIGATALVVLSAVTAIFAPAALAGAAGSALDLVIRVVGGAGFVLAIAGALGLLHRRLTDEELKPYTTAGDLFNLAAFIGALGVLAAGLLLQPAGAPGIRGVVTGLLTWDTAVQVPGVLAAGLGLTVLLAAYVPFTHMSHFVGKYFTYHSVRWDDAINRRGGAIEKRLAGYLAYRPTWAAKHVTADGVRTWADVVTTNPAEGTKR